MENETNKRKFLDGYLLEAELWPHSFHVLRLDDDLQLKDYEVDLLDGTCTCEAGRHGTPCKHLPMCREWVTGKRDSDRMPPTLRPFFGRRDPRQDFGEMTLITKLSGEEILRRLPPGFGVQLYPGPRGIPRNRFQQGYRMRLFLRVRNDWEEQTALELLEVSGG